MMGIDMIGLFDLLLILLLGGGVVIGGILLLVSLLSKKNTRAIGLGILAMLGLCVLVVPAFLFLSYPQSREVRELTRQQSQAEARAARTGEILPEKFSREPSATVTPDSASTPAFLTYEQSSGQHSNQHSSHAMTSGEAIMNSSRLSLLGALVVALLLVWAWHASDHARSIIKAGAAVAAIVALLALATTRDSSRQLGHDSPSPVAVETEMVESPPLIFLDPEPAMTISESPPDHVSPADGKEEANSSRLPAAPEPTEPKSSQEKLALRGDSYGKGGRSAYANEKENRTEKAASINKSTSSGKGKSQTPSVAKHPKPDWVTNPPKRVGTEMRRVVTSGPYKTVDFCEEEIDRQLGNLLLTFVRQLRSSHLRATLDADRPYSFAELSSLRITPRYAREKICLDSYTEEIETRSVGTMKQVSVLVEINPKVQRDLHRRVKQSRMGDRLELVTMISVFSLGFLAVVWGFFKLDTVTKGFYTKRLILCAVVATMGIGALSALAGFTVDELMR